MKQFLVTVFIMCCVNEMICYALLAIWNGFCIIMNHVHNYFCCHIIIYMEMILVYTETWKHSQTMIMLFLNNFTYTLWPHQCFLAIACESSIATGKNLYPKIIISKHWSQTMEKCFCCCSANGKCQVGISCCNHVMSVMWKLLNESL